VKQTVFGIRRTGTGFEYFVVAQTYRTPSA
jgi:hypothetical protein